MDISTETQPTGTAHLRKHVVTETETVEVPVSHEEVRVVREPITDPSSVRPGKLGEEDREVTLHGENVTVTKESVPVERVRLDVDTVEGTETVTESVRKERIETEGVERNISDERRH